MVIEAQKTDERNSKKGQYDSSHTFVQTAGNGVKAQMSYIGRGCSPLPGWAVGARARWQQESARELGSLADPGEPWAPLERLISPCSGLIWFSWGAQKKKKNCPPPIRGSQLRCPRVTLVLGAVWVANQSSGSWRVGKQRWCGTGRTTNGYCLGAAPDQ